MPVSCKLVPAIDPQGEYHNPRAVWADADIEEAAAALRWLKARPAVRRDLGHAAAIARGGSVLRCEICRSPGGDPAPLVQVSA